MVNLKYIGTHQPAGMLIEVEQKDVKRLLESGEYKLLEAKKIVIIPKEESNDNSKRFEYTV